MTHPPPPFRAQRFRPISAHSALTVIASEKSSIRTYRKSTTHFPTSHRWTVYVSPKSPKGWHKKRYRCLCQYNLTSLEKSGTMFLCVKTSNGKVVATSFPYPTVHTSIADDVPIYLKLAFKMMHPFRKRRFRKLSLDSALSATASTNNFCDRNLAKRIQFFSNILLMAIFAGNHPSEGVKMTNSRLRGWIRV